MKCTLFLLCFLSILSVNAADDNMQHKEMRTILSHARTLIYRQDTAQMQLTDKQSLATLLSSFFYINQQLAKKNKHLAQEIQNHAQYALYHRINNRNAPLDSMVRFFLSGASTPEDITANDMFHLARQLLHDNSRAQKMFDGPYRLGAMIETLMQTNIELTLKNKSCAQQLDQLNQKVVQPTLRQAGDCRDLLQYKHESGLTIDFSPQGKIDWQKLRPQLYNTRYKSTAQRAIEKGIAAIEIMEQTDMTYIAHAYFFLGRAYQCGKNSTMARENFNKASDHESSRRLKDKAARRLRELDQVENNRSNELLHGQSTVVTNHRTRKRERDIRSNNHKRQRTAPSSQESTLVQKLVCNPLYMSKPY